MIERKTSTLRSAPIEISMIMFLIHATSYGDGFALSAAPPGPPKLILLSGCRRKSCSGCK